MGLKKDRRMLGGLRRSWMMALAVGGMLFYGCGSSEGTTTAQTEGEAQKSEQPAAPMEQALTSFTTEKDSAQAEKPAEPQKPAEQPMSQMAQYEKQITDLQTENTSLKQKIVKLEQDNRTLNARVTETEGKLIAEKERADKAEEAAKGAPAVGVKAPSGEAKMPAPAGTSVAGYDEALKAFLAKKYDEAQQGFQALLDGGITQDLADNCTYWIGETNYAKRKFADALKNFQDVLQFKVSEKKGDAQYMIAQTYERMGNKVKAKEAYEQVVKNYPMNSHVKRAKERWAKL